jgi:hypothetical protein
MVRVWSKYSCGATVVSEKAVETFSTADTTAPTGLKRSRGREEQHVVLALVVPFFVIRLNNTTPILPTSVKSAIRGIHGMAGQCGCRYRCEKANQDLIG